MGNIWPGLDMTLDFCASKVIDHFMCEMSPILQISCTDTSVLELMSFSLDTWGHIGISDSFLHLHH